MLKIKIKYRPYILKVDIANKAFIDYCHKNFN